MTMPDTTPMPNDTAKILIQKFEILRKTALPVARCSPSSTAIYEASPIVKAGSRKWNTTTKANCKRERTSASRFMDHRRLRFLFHHVTSGGRLDARVIGIAGRIGCRHFGACQMPEPLAPLGPPAARHILRGLEPPVRIGSCGASDPVVALVLGRGIDHPCNVAASTEDEGRVAGKQLRRSVRRAPGHDVVFARRVKERGYVDQRQVDRLAALHRLARGAQVVLEVGVPNVPAEHGAGQIGAIRVPV